VKAAKQVIERSYSAQQVYESIRMPEAERPYFTPGFPKALPLIHGSRVKCVGCEPYVKLNAPEMNPIVSDTGELVWRTSKENGGLVTVDTPRSQALIGFVKSNGIATKHMLADVKNEFCSLTLSSLDSKPIARAQRMLFTASARTLNSGFQWNERHTLLTQLGGPPTLIEPVTGWIMLRELEGAVGLKVTALDGAAKPKGDEIRGRRMEDGWEFAIGTPATTFYLIEVVR
jgi:hypothetical protein